MSVLIKGMEMPMGCYECPFEVWGKCMFIHYNAGGEELSKKCPLVEVPPHRRLKDVDELKEWIEAWFTMHRGYHPYSKSNLIPSTELIDIIDRLPTIIEAEGEAEE